MVHAAQQNPQSAPATAEQRYVGQVAQTAVNPAQAAYRSLVGDIAANEPRDGFATTIDLPDLSDEQCAVVLRANPDVLNDADIDPGELADIYARPDASLTGLYTRLGVYLDERLRPHIKRWLLEDVQDEVERDAEIVHQDALDPYQRRGDTL